MQKMCSNLMNMFWYYKLDQELRNKFNCCQIISKGGPVAPMGRKYIIHVLYYFVVYDCLTETFSSNISVFCVCIGSQCRSLTLPRKKSRISLLKLMSSVLQFLYLLHKDILKHYSHRSILFFHLFSLSNYNNYLATTSNSQILRFYKLLLLYLLFCPNYLI